MFHRPGYNRPENLWKDFTVESKTETLTNRGRATDKYDSENTKHISAILCGATPDQILKFKQAEHPISHVISHPGSPCAKAGDRLVYNNRMFYVQNLDNPGEQNLWTLYYCEEREGTHDGNQLE